MSEPHSLRTQEGPSPRVPASPDPDAPDNEAPEPGLGSFIPFDPLRLVLALRRRAWALALGALILGVPVGMVGSLHLRTTYTVPIQLIRRELPNSFRASELGEAFKPRQFSIATVVAMMQSPSLLAKVGGQANPRLSASALLNGLTITPERNTDLINVSLRSSVDAATATELVNAYAQEVVDLTRTLQQQEAAELDRFLRDQLARTEGDLAEVNQEILRFTREENYLDADKEIEAYLRLLGDAETALQNTRLEAENIAFRIRALETEISRQSPSLAGLAEARARLNELLVQFTDAHPAVVSQRARVAAIEDAAAAVAAVGTNAPGHFQAGPNSVANAMFLDLINLRAQREARASQLQQYEERRAAVLAKLQGLPEKGMKYAKLKARQVSLDTTRAFLSGRQREARLFSEDSPGYYRLFALATEADVVTSDKSRKLAIVTTAAALAGILAAALLVCLLEALDDRVVSPADIRRATRLPLVGRLEDLDSTPAPDLPTWRYRTWSLLSRLLSDPSTRSVFCGILSAQHGEGRTTWLRLLAEAARERGQRSVRFQPAGAPLIPSPDAVLPLPQVLADPDLLTQALRNPSHRDLVVEIPADWSWPHEHRASWRHALGQWRHLEDLVVLLELPPASSLDAILLAESLPGVLWLAASGMNRQSDIASFVETAQQGHSQLKGALLNRMPAPFRRLPDLGRFGL